MYNIIPIQNLYTIPSDKTKKYTPFSKLDLSLYLCSMSFAINVHPVHTYKYIYENDTQKLFHRKISFERIVKTPRHLSFSIKYILNNRCWWCIHQKTTIHFTTHSIYTLIYFSKNKSVKVDQDFVFFRICVYGYSRIFQFRVFLITLFILESKARYSFSLIFFIFSIQPFVRIDFWLIGYQFKGFSLIKILKDFGEHDLIVGWL